MYIISGVEIVRLIRSARQVAGLTQRELACRAHTAQPAIAAYESGARTPNIDTLERLLGACDHDVEVLARPRVRRGAASLAELAPTITDDLAADRERDAVRLLFGFADDFRGSSRPGRVALIRDEPPSTGDLRFDAALAGVAELFAAEGAIPAPAWVNDPIRFVEPWWFLASRPAFHAYTLAHTPAVLARHGVFIAREVFDRA
jgi:transcriptional regulator with XRE-family HTH domain